MSILESLITNRTAEDVARWKELRDKGFDTMTEEEKAEWMAGMRGAYNAVDLNRITSAMGYLKGLYEQYGRQVTYTPTNIAHVDGTTDTTWRLTDIPTEEQLTLLLQNLLAFWKGVETADGNVVDVWAATQFGYVEMSASVKTGDYVAITSARGIHYIVVTAQGSALSGITATGTGWVSCQSDSAITAKYEVPQGVFLDLQDALDALVFLCSSGGSYADASVTVTAVMRSGAEIHLGAGYIHWSAIINWKAFEAYAYTWQDIENAGMTWDALESLPAPNIGGAI